MKKKIVLILLCVIVLFGISGVILLLTLQNNNKVENNKEEQQFVFTETATCYSGYGDIGNATIELKGNNTQTKVIGRTIKTYSINSIVADIIDENIVDDYPNTKADEIVKSILYTQTKEIDKFNMKEIDSDVSNSHRNESSSYDNYTYEITYEYIVDKTLNEYIDILENTNNSNYKFTCIVDDKNDLLGTWEGIDNNFVYNYPHNVKITFNSSNSGSLYASSTNPYVQDKEYIIKYNIIDNKLKVVYLQNEKIKNVEYTKWKGSKEFDIEKNTISYINYGEKITLNKQN